MSFYPLEIVTPDGKIWDKEVESVTAPGTEGRLGVLANHAPMVTLLKSGAIHIRHDAGENFFVVGKGILEVDSVGKVLVLCDRAEEVASYQEAQQAEGAAV